MQFITNALKKLPDYRELSTAIKTGNYPVVATGVSGIHKCGILYSLCEETQKRALVIASDESEALRFFTDLTAMGMTPVIYPLRDFCFRDIPGSSHEYEHQRLTALSKLLGGNCNCIIATIDAALQYTIGPTYLKHHTVTITSGEDIKPEALISKLIACGYTREEQIEGVSQFSQRGGIVDFYSPSSHSPVRIEFWGDTIDSISYFEISSQRRTDNLNEATFSPCVEVILDNPEILSKQIDQMTSSIRGKSAVKAKEILRSEAEKLKSKVHIGSLDKFISLVYDRVYTLFDFFQGDECLLFFSEINALKERIKNTIWQWGEDLVDYLSDGVLCKGFDQYTETWAYALNQMEKTPSLLMDNFMRGSYEVPTKTMLNFTVRQLTAWNGGISLLKEDLQSALGVKRSCVLLAGTEKAAKTLADDLLTEGIAAIYLDAPSSPPSNTVVVTSGTLTSGFEFPEIGLSVFTHGRAHQELIKKKNKKKNISKSITSLSDITIGDYVVHNLHGIGIFEGIHKIEMDGIQKDYIKVKYAKSDTLYVPVTQLDMVSKYIGPRENSKLALNKLGGTEWQKTKARVRKAVKDIAEELTKLYAERMQQKGFAFPEDEEWQRDFEGHFEFEETDDQLRCINEIKDDMEREIPMDRLLCGDVGFGKTEVALRAAFKCVTGGKQCAILVPTTILAWQHYQTMLKRFEGFAVDVELLSRFRSPKEQEKIISKVRRGAIDVVVGTHRLVSKDVQFKDLGLAVIDEEQRFGVAQKEKLKAICKSADILTLSATPIPRTLNMALSGIRDMSVIDEAPHDRQPVQTYVIEYDFGMILNALKKELRRGGQVYYLHNDVATMSRVAAKLQEHLPDARVGIGHGKMNEDELGEVWGKLLDHEIDILVCTTIIETGVDVSNANTLIIDNADKMGLSQLHQIRGRVGRSSRRSYAYLTYKRNKVLTEIAQKRLSAIREFTEFGSGFKIAMRDLEIRGAGNVLGGEQHGHMETVGYDMYVKLLNEAVSLMKGEPVQTVEEECLVDMQIEAYLPEKYVNSMNLRIDLYRRIAEIKTFEDASDVTDEIIDRFGDLPDAVQGLIDIALLRSKASSLGISEIKQQGGALLLFKKQFDMKEVSFLIKQMNGRILLSAGTKPYISVKLLKDEPLKALSSVINLMLEGKAAAVKHQLGKC